MRLLPVLKPASWDGPSVGAHAHLWVGSPQEPEIYVGYAWESRDGLTYATQETCGEHGSDEIVRQAFANLEECEVTFELVEANNAKVLVSVAHPFSAEQVLSERLMLGVHDALGADDVVVSIARRGSMLACARDCPDEAKKTLVDLHLEAWLGAADHDRITNQLIAFSQATKAEMMELSGDGKVRDWA